MAADQYIWFSGLNAPVCLKPDTGLLSLIDEIMPGWPREITASTSVAPCVTLSSADKGKFHLLTSEPRAVPRRWDAVNAVCDLTAELAWEQIRSASEMLSLHSASVVHRERLILFPNTRRAGKSTLCACLMQRGFEVFSDDVVPLRFESGGVIEGLSAGILPRVRLPLPPEFPKSFTDWVAGNPAPSNAQYKYLQSDAVPSRGKALPIGMIMLLERAEEPMKPSLKALSPQDALQEMVVQNFAREAHAGRILKALEAIVVTVACFKLCYSSAIEAADFLAQALNDIELGEARIDQPLESQPATLEPRQVERTPIDPSQSYRRAPGLTETEMDGEVFVADDAGFGIFRLNPGSALIWKLLEEPASQSEAIEILHAAFPDIDLKQIETDCIRTFAQFRGSRLIQPLDAD